MITEDNVPKPYFYHLQNEKNKPKIIRPDVEIEVPDFIALADEIEEERIRILNKTPVPFLTAAEQRRKDKNKQKRLLKAQKT